MPEETTATRSSKTGLTARILVGMVAGIILGLLLNVTIGVVSPQEEARRALLELRMDATTPEALAEPLRDIRVLLEESTDQRYDATKVAAAREQIQAILAQEVLAEEPLQRALSALDSADAKAGTARFVTPWLQDGILTIVGQVFVAALRLMVVPIVFVSLVVGVAALGDPKKLGRISLKTMALYLGTTALAITLALSLASLVQPGAGLQLDTDIEYTPPESRSLVDVLVGIFPTNPVESLAAGNMLQIIVFAILFGVAMTLIGPAGERIRQFFADLNEIILKIVMIIIELAPYGVFALLANVFATQGLAAIAPLAKYFGLVLVVLLVHGVVVYGGILTLLARVNPLTFFQKMRANQVFAFSTSSSNATIPVTLETVQDRLGVKGSVASFTVPLGATINMDGTAIMQGCATIFIAQVFGVDLSFGQLLTVILTATLASIGTAGVPSAGLVMLALVLEQVGLPVEGIALIIGIDRFLDMARTALNVTGDAAVSTIVAKSEGQFDESIFNAKN